MATNTTTKKKAPAKRRSRAVTIESIEMKPVTIKQELGRRRNNKARKAAGEKVVRSKAYYLPMFSKDEFDKVLAGEVVRKEFRSSGRIVDFSLASA